MGKGATVEKEVTATLSVEGLALGLEPWHLSCHGESSLQGVVETTGRGFLAA